MSSEFNPATIPAESTEQGGRGSGRWEQNAVLDYVRQFNNAVLSAGPRPGIVSRNESRSMPLRSFHPAVLDSGVNK